jgi:predicted HNH restriction endonuclease
MITSREAQQRHRVYMQTDEWRELRAQALERDGFRCRLCDSKTAIEVHHRRYPRRDEIDHVRNLTCLCATCHGNFHDDLMVFVMSAGGAMLIGLVFGALFF